MKILNFTATEILPSLLNKTKGSTIRPAWKDTKRILKNLNTHLKPEFIQRSSKSPRFRVGEKIKIVWSKRSKHTHFCSAYSNANFGYECKRLDCPLIFKKLIGIAKITEVFEIEIKKIVNPTKFVLTSKYKAIDLIPFNNERIINVQKIAVKDGFNSAEEMFKWFDKKYDLSVAKKFFVYRWKWLKASQ